MPGQYSFPLNLPNSFLGFGRTRTLPEDPQDTPFGAEIDYAIFGSGGPRRSWEAAELIQVNKCPFTPPCSEALCIVLLWYLPPCPMNPLAK